MANKYFDITNDQAIASVNVDSTNQTFGGIIDNRQIIAVVGNVLGTIDDMFVLEPEPEPDSKESRRDGSVLIKREFIKNLEQLLNEADGEGITNKRVLVYLDGGEFIPVNPGTQGGKTCIKKQGLGLVVLDENLEFKVTTNMVLI